MSNKNEKLLSLREEINEIDIKLVELLVERANLALRISELKSDNVDAVQAKDRVEAVIGNVRELARKVDGDEDFVEKIYRELISVLTEMQLKKKGLLETC